MKRILQFINFIVLPIITLAIFTAIGDKKAQIIAIEEGKHRTMSASITSMAWTYRGIYAMALIIIFSLVLYSKLSKKIKVSVFMLMLMLILNLPLIYFMELAIFLPAGLILIPIVNLIALAPTFVGKANKKSNDLT